VLKPTRLPAARFSDTRLEGEPAANAAHGDSPDALTSRRAPVRLAAQLRGCTLRRSRGCRTGSRGRRNGKGGPRFARGATTSLRVARIAPRPGEGPAIHRKNSEPESFRCDVAREGEVVRITLAGELDLASSAEVEPVLRQTGPEPRLLDLRELTFMDSSGLRLILSAHTAARREGRSLAIVPGPPAVQRVFQICGVADELRFVAP
jgi:anti-anti-sigma factor